MNLKVGDKVKLKNRRGSYWNQEGEMDKYMGKVVTISNIYSFTERQVFTIKEDDGNNWFKKWYFFSEDIECVVKQKHFKSLPNDYTGTIEVENGFIQKREILDDTEKRYLKAVIRPFKDKIENISKETTSRGACYIYINLGDDGAALPYFKKGTMYNGMEDDKEYTLKELELDV